MKTRFQIALGILGLVAIVLVPVIFTPASASYRVRENYNGDGYRVDYDNGSSVTCRSAYNGDGYNCH